MILLIFMATHTHPAVQCPLNSEEGKTMLKRKFTEENMKNSGIKMHAAYLSCPEDTREEHKGFFAVEAKDAEEVNKFFAPMSVEIRPVQPFSELAKKL